MNKLKAYECGLRYDGYHGYIIHSTSRGKAKSRFLRELDMDGINYTDIICRCIGKPVNTESFCRMADRRDIPEAYIGMNVELEGRGKGVISGCNSSCNLNVLFEDGNTFNCHPNWKMKYYDHEGNIVYDFTQERN